MTSGSGVHSWRRFVAGSVTGGALVLGLLAGVPSAAADPTQPSAEADAPAADPQISPQMTADQALAIIAKDYDTGAGGGQLSQLIHEILTLRQQGYKASNANREAIAKALEKRPNQVPLIDALKGTLAYQRKMQAQSNAQVSGGGISAGINQAAPGTVPSPNNTGVFIGPSGGIQQPLG